MLYNHSQLLFSEAVTQRCSLKKMFLEILQNSLENTCARVFFFNKVAGSGLQLNYKRDTGTGIFCEFCKISRSTFSYRSPPVSASMFCMITEGCNL